MAAESIDKVVLELEARLGRYTADVQGASNTTERQLARIETSATKMERAVGRSFQNAAQQSRLLGYQISDIGVQLSSGTSPFIVLAQQGPQVANALDGARGAVGRFATFLSGPWGAAILAGTTLLGAWLSKTNEAAESVDDLVEKLKAQARQSELTDRANDAFGRTLEGLEQAADQARKSIDALQLVQKSQAEKSVESTRESLKNAEAIRETTKARLADALAILELEKAQSNSTFANADEAIAQQRDLDRRIAGVKALQAEMARAEKVAADFRREYDRAVSARTIEQENASAEDKINRKYDTQIDRAAKAADASKKSQDSLRAEVRTINEAREAELKRIRDTQREQRKTRTSLPTVTGAEVARALGTTINSGTRTASENARVRGAKNSYHLSGQAIDIPLTVNGKPLTKEGIRSALEPLGIVIKELLGPGDKGHSDHFHIAFDKRRRGADDVAATAQRAVDAEERRRQSYENELAAAKADELAATRALITNAEQIAKLNLETIEVERQRYNDNLDSLVARRKLREDEAAELRRINDETAKYRVEMVQRNAQIRDFRIKEAQRQRDEQYASVARADQAEVLRGQGDLARTLHERNEIESHLVDLKYQEERAANDAVIAAAERLRIEKEAGRASQEELDAALDRAKIARLRNASIDQRKGADLESISRNNPIGRYLDDISDTQRRVEEATVRELQAVNDGITDALTSQLGIKNQFVKDLFSIFLDDVIFRPLAEALRSSQSGGGGLFGSILGSIGGLVGGLFGGGGGGVNSAVHELGHRASGGPVEAGRLYRINESGVEGFVPATSGKIIPAGQMNAIAARGGGQSGGVATVQLALSGDIDARIVRVSGPVAVEVVRASAPTIIEGSVQETFRRSGRPKM